ncbi:MAG: hypothetical protein NVS4B7_10050 [Ktedonobacteraceae bacterium]
MWLLHSDNVSAIDAIIQFYFSQRDYKFFRRDMNMMSACVVHVFMRLKEATCHAEKIGTMAYVDTKCAARNCDCLWI